MYYNSNECKTCKREYEQQFEQTSSVNMCCYPSGWYCDGYRGFEEENRKENYCGCEKRNKCSNQNDFYGWKNENSWIKENNFDRDYCYQNQHKEDCYFENKHSFNQEQNANKNCCRKKCNFCKIFSCFCRH